MENNLNNLLNSNDDKINDQNEFTHNKVVKVSVVGGIIGFFAGSHEDSINKTIIKENSNGWDVVQVFPDTSTNFIIQLLRGLLLIITVFFYTINNGYFIVFKRKTK
jgi:hypothetical protein